MSSLFFVIIRRKEMNGREKIQDLRPMTKISIAKSIISSLLVTTMYQFDYFVHCLKYIQIIGVVYRKNITSLIFFFNKNVLNQKHADNTTRELKTNLLGDQCQIYQFLNSQKQSLTTVTIQSNLYGCNKITTT